MTSCRLCHGPLASDTSHLIHSFTLHTGSFVLERGKEWISPCHSKNLNHCFGAWGLLLNIKQKQAINFKMVVLATFNSVSSWNAASSLPHLCLRRRKNSTPLRFSCQVLQGPWITLTWDAFKPLLQELFLNAAIQYHSYEPQMPTETLRSTLQYKLLEHFIKVFSSNHLLVFKLLPFTVTFNETQVLSVLQVQFFLNYLFFSRHSIVSIMQK